MLHIQSLREGLPLFKALGSETRISILELLIDKGPMRMTAIADALGITGGALTSHVKELGDAGILTIELKGGRHGIQKICHVNDERILIESLVGSRNVSVYETEISVGQFTACDVHPACGVATPAHVVEPADDPRSFASPERMKAGILWFKRGFVEYLVPNFLKAEEELLEIQVSLELSASLPAAEGRLPGDIQFRLNGKDIGTWTSPGQSGGAQGIYNPAWWPKEGLQHGLFKLLTVNQSGTFVDGVKISDTALKALKIQSNVSIPLRLSAPEAREDAQGGLTLFGCSFGNYAQDIKVRMHYTAKNAK